MKRKGYAIHSNMAMLLSHLGLTIDDSIIQVWNTTVLLVTSLKQLILCYSVSSIIDSSHGIKGRVVPIGFSFVVNESTNAGLLLT